ncbi:MAG: replication-relaxation family protein [Planctomycetota bacterium]
MPLQLTHRDEQTLLALLKLPLTSQQVFSLSRTFTDPFPSERVTRRRLQRLAEERMIRRFYFAFPRSGRNPAYWRLTRRSYHLIGSLTGELPLPKRSLFAAIGVSLHFHAYSVSQAVVKILIDAQRNGIEIEDLKVETAIDLGGEEQLVPDATVELCCSERRLYRFHLEIDTASERVATRQRLPSSIQKKLESYERYRRIAREPFRVLFLTTSSKRRAINILQFAATLTGNFSARTIYATYLPEVLACPDAVTADVFLNHKLGPQKLARKPRFCRLGISTLSRDRIMADLNAKELTR